VHGQARGRTIGFPTANLLPEQPYVIPRTGVYAVTVGVSGGTDGGNHTYDAVLNVGFRPTFEIPMGELKLEAHLFGFEGDLYGSALELTFHAYIREERKFASAEELKQQIAKDAERAVSILQDAGK
jgi:riboflavin kinase/FMN adenylyltransferase